MSVLRCALATCWEPNWRMTTARLASYTAVLALGVGIGRRWVWTSLEDAPLAPDPDTPILPLPDMDGEGMGTERRWGF